MINYTEKGHGLHKLIKQAGYKLAQNNGVWSSTDDVAVQAIIDNYDELAEAKTRAKERLRDYATSLVLIIYPVYPATADIRGIYNQLTDLYSGGLPLPPRLQQVKDLRDIFIAKRIGINALTDWKLTDSYDATVGW